MPTKREKRLQRELKAASFLEENHGPMATLFEEVAADLGEELVGLKKAARTARMASEMAYRLDKLVDLSGLSPIAEALDWFGFFLGSLGFLALVDAVESAARRRGKRVARLQQRLDMDGQRLSKMARVRLERRISRLEAKG